MATREEIIEEDLGFEDQLHKIVELTETLQDEAEVALSGQRGWKAAHQRVRKLISELRHRYPELKKSSLVEERG